MSAAKGNVKANRTTMEGMIFNANQVLDKMLDPKTPGVPRNFLEIASGVVLVSVVEVGFMFSGNVGTGVVMSRDVAGRWSPPSAIGMGGVGFGFLFGANVKDIMILLMDEAALKTLSGEAQVKLGGELALTVGPVGREIEGAFNFSNKGVGITLTYCMSQGAFAGIGLEGAILGARSKENERFYGKKASPTQILMERGVVEIPAGHGIEELHRKLDLMASGLTVDPSDSDKAKLEELRKKAEESGEAARVEQGDEVTFVDAKEEAAKESSTVE